MVVFTHLRVDHRRLKRWEVVLLEVAEHVTGVVRLAVDGRAVAPWIGAISLEQLACEVLGRVDGLFDPARVACVTRRIVCSFLLCSSRACVGKWWCFYCQNIA